MRSFIFLLILVFTNTLLANTYQTPSSFMDLFFDFTGGKPQSIGTILSKSMSEKQDGPLVLFIDSDFYIYNSDRKLLAHTTLRTQPNSGFFEVTAVSHIGPAMAYLLALKEQNNPAWKTSAKHLLSSIKAVRKINAQKSDNWLQQLNQPAWAGRDTSIQRMIDYACALSENYLTGILNGQAFTQETLVNNYLNSHSKDFPIPYDNVMVGTFMLVGMQSAYKIHTIVNELNIDWSKSRVILRNVAGANVTGGLSKGNNWLYTLVMALSDNKIPENRILIPAYAQVKSSLGKNILSTEDYNYYANTVWASAYDREQVTNRVFTMISNIKPFSRPALPGDYNITPAGNIQDFLIRLKYSFGDPTQLLSNTIGFWLPGALQAANWNFNKVKLPGLDTGFPKGISGYPEIGV